MKTAVWITPRYPCGFCPIHCFEGVDCQPWCWPTRVRFAQLAHDLEQFWRTPAGKAHLITSYETGRHDCAVAVQSTRQLA